MSNKLVKQILNKKFKCIFISPHFDDAVLSCGSLLMHLTGKTSITIINVFTKAHKKPYTLSARKFLKESNGGSDATVLFKERFKEDKNVLSSLNVKIINLGLVDALFRKKNNFNFLGKVFPEINHIYPTYKWHVVRRISPHDHATTQLKKILKKFNGEKILVFAPYGIGNHADHVITRKVCEDLFDNLILYSDFPYNLRANNYGHADESYQEFEL